MITIGSQVKLKKKYWNDLPHLRRDTPFTVIEINSGECRVCGGYWISEELLEDVFSVNLKKVLG